MDLAHDVGQVVSEVQMTFEALPWWLQALLVAIIVVSVFSFWWSRTRDRYR